MLYDNMLLDAAEIKISLLQYLSLAGEIENITHHG
jgi:hypothetical protein